MGLKIQRRLASQTPVHIRTRQHTHTPNLTHIRTHPNMKKHPTTEMSRDLCKSARDADTSTKIIKISYRSGKFSPAFHQRVHLRSAVNSSGSLAPNLRSVCAHTRNKKVDVEIVPSDKIKHKMLAICVSMILNRLRMVKTLVLYLCIRMFRIPCVRARAVEPSEDQSASDREAATRGKLRGVWPRPNK